MWSCKSSINASRPYVSELLFQNVLSEHHLKLAAVLHGLSIFPWPAAGCNLVLPQAQACVLSTLKVKTKGAKGNKCKKKKQPSLYPSKCYKGNVHLFWFSLVTFVQELLSLLWFLEGHKTTTNSTQPLFPTFKNYATSVIQVRYK